MSTVAEHRKLTQAELVAELCDRFGDDWRKWAFRCPRCSDIATGLDISIALTNYPRKGHDGQEVLASTVLGQECIGRILRPQGEERGCDWAAYGLLRGPWELVLPTGQSVWCFPIAPAAAHPAP
ncbi:VVA0879 family protein [Streptosporangium sp. NPDC049078]|uniref:VVA0879 family protein n=1 Tax=Streptosporangium sp. NPDC049078 TaxID=3155767 RepID=UPI003443BDE2